MQMSEESMNALSQMCLDHWPHWHACYVHEKTGTNAQMVWLTGDDVDEARRCLRGELERVLTNQNIEYEEDEWTEIHVFIVNGN